MHFRHMANQGYPARRCMARPQAALLGSVQCRKEALTWQNAPYPSYGPRTQGGSIAYPRRAAGPVSLESLGTVRRTAGTLLRAQRAPSSSRSPRGNRSRLASRLRGLGGGAFAARPAPRGGGPGPGGPAGEGAHQGPVRDRVERRLSQTASAGRARSTGEPGPGSCRPGGAGCRGRDRGASGILSECGARRAGFFAPGDDAAAAPRRADRSPSEPRSGEQRTLTSSRNCTARAGSRSSRSGLRGRASRRGPALLGLARARPPFPHREHRLVHRRVPRRRGLALLLARGVGLLRAARPADAHRRYRARVRGRVRRRRALVEAQPRPRHGQPRDGLRRACPGAGSRARGLGHFRAARLGMGDRGPRRPGRLVSFAVPRGGPSRPAAGGSTRALARRAARPGDPRAGCGRALSARRARVPPLRARLRAPLRPRSLARARWPFASGSSLLRSSRRARVLHRPARGRRAARTLGLALAAREPAYLELSAALAAAHFAAGIAWYRRPLLVYFSLAAGAASVVSLLVSSRLARAAVDAACALSGSGPATRGETLCVAALGILACSALAASLDRRFHQRGDPRLGSAAGRSDAVLLLLAATGSLSAAAAGSRLGPALVLALWATLLATWHRRAPRQWTAWSGAAALFGALALALLRASLAPGTALALAGVALMLASFPFLQRGGERLGASALVHWSLLAAGAALAADLFSNGDSWRRGLALFAVLWGAGAVVLGNGAVGLLASSAGLCLLGLALSLLGPTVFRSWPSSDVRWAALPAGALAASFALRSLSRAWKGPRPLLTPLPFPQPGLLALAQPLLGWGALATALLALRGGFSIDVRGALLLGAAAVCAIALAALCRDARWSAAAAGFAIVAGAWQATSLLGLRVPAAALGGALAASAVLALARVLRTRAGAHAEAVIALSALALALVAAVAVGSAAIAFGFLPSANDLRLSCAALSVCAAALIALAAPLRTAAGYPALIALAAWAFCLPPALGWSSALSGAALVTLALLLLWARKALSGGPPWSAPLLLTGPHLVAAAALVWNLVSPGPFLDWNRALCDGLLAAYLASALAVEGGVVYLHLLLALTALGIVRARTLLGIVPSGWGTVVAGAGLIGIALVLRRRQKYATALLLWSALSLAYTCAWTLGAPFVRADRWNRMAAAAFVAVPLAAGFFPAATSGAAVAALTAALLGAVPALLPTLWTSTTWPLPPVALALLFALAAEPLDRLRPSLFCAPAPLARSLRAAAVVLASVPAGFAAYAVLAAAVRLPGVSPAGPGLVAAVPLALAGAALALAFRKLPGAPGPAWALSIAASLALCAALLP